MTHSPTITNNHEFVDFLDDKSVKLDMLEKIYSILNKYYGKNNVFEDDTYRGLRYIDMFDDVKYLIIKKDIPHKVHIGTIDQFRELSLFDVVKFIEHHLQPTDKIIDRVKSLDSQIKPINTTVEGINCDLCVFIWTFIIWSIINSLFLLIILFKVW